MIKVIAVLCADSRLWDSFLDSLDMPWYVRTLVYARCCNLAFVRIVGSWSTTGITFTGIIRLTELPFEVEEAVIAAIQPVKTNG